MVTTIWLIISWSDPRQKPEFGKLDNDKNERTERKKREIRYCDLKFLNIEVLTKDTTRKPVFS